MFIRTPKFPSILLGPIGQEADTSYIVLKKKGLITRLFHPMIGIK